MLSFGISLCEGCVWSQHCYHSGFAGTYGIGVSGMPSQEIMYYGYAKKLSGVDPKHYEALLKDAEELNDGK